MHFTLASAILAIGAATSAFADDIQVTLEPGAFSPNNVTAQAGDTITFIFPSSNHSVTQSNFSTPCLPLAGGIDSGFEPVADNSTDQLTFTITINDTSSLWFHCAQTGHCQKGQVFAVNPTDNETLTEFQTIANGSSADGTPSSNSTSKSSSPSSTTAGHPSSTTSSTASKSSSSSSATNTGARVGGLLAAVGFVAGILL
ncbi:hypothetical protein V8E53_012609 [Lactarius tabidus]